VLVVVLFKLKLQQEMGGEGGWNLQFFSAFFFFFNSFVAVAESEDFALLETDGCDLPLFSVL